MGTVGIDILLGLHEGLTDLVGEIHIATLVDQVLDDIRSTRCCG